jgi:hypothetical protein
MKVCPKLLNTHKYLRLKDVEIIHLRLRSLAIQGCHLSRRCWNLSLIRCLWYGCSESPENLQGRFSDSKAVTVIMLMRQICLGCLLYWSLRIYLSIGAVMLKCLFTSIVQVLVEVIGCGSFSPIQLHKLQTTLSLE